MEAHDLLGDLDLEKYSGEVSVKTYASTDFKGENKKYHLFIFDGEEPIKTKELNSDDECRKIIQELTGPQNSGVILHDNEESEGIPELHH